jgi:hypothetical protein
MKAPDWSNLTAVIVCAGPSLADEQLHAVKESTATTIAVNSAYLYVPWAEVVFAADFMFWKLHNDRIKAQFKGVQRWTTDSSAAERFQINRQRGGNREGLGTEICHTGSGNSGMIAINLAYLWGARKILLVGMDMREIDGKKHRHGDHEKGLTQVQLFSEWIHKGKKLAEDLNANGCDVVNCTPGSALPWFRFSTLEKELG